MKTPKTMVFKSRITHNAASLYAVQVCRKVIPIFTIPYLARVLGPSGWGDVAFTLSMGDFIATFAEFGFLLSATRELAQNRDSKEASSMIASSTMGAQALLATVGVLVAVVASAHVPLLRSHPKLLWAGLTYGAAQGIAPLWLFQGLERMALAAALEVSCKVVALAAIFLLVHNPTDEWKVLAFQSLAPIVTSGVAIWMAHRLLRLTIPSVTMMWEAIRGGWPMFLLRSGIATYSTANVLILALFAPANIVGYYAAAEKLAKAMLGLLSPIRDAFYPRLSRLAVHSPAENDRLTRISAVIEGACGLALSIITWVYAATFVRIVFGDSFGDAVVILRILAVVPFIFSIADAIGFQSLLPAGKESLATKAIAIGALVNVTLAAFLAPRFHGIGMAVAVVVTEIAVCTILVCVVAKTTKLFQRRRLSPVEAVSFSRVLADVSRRNNE